MAFTLEEIQCWHLAEANRIWKEGLADLFSISVLQFEFLLFCLLFNTANVAFKAVHHATPMHVNFHHEQI